MSGWRDLSTWETLTFNFDKNSMNVTEAQMNKWMDERMNVKAEVWRDLEYNTSL